MMIVESGKVVELCAEPGEFVYDTETEPSIFYGPLGENIKRSFSEIGKRFTFGGEPAKDQRVYYFNTKEIIGNKYGTPSPVPFRVVDNNIGLDNVMTPIAGTKWQGQWDKSTMVDKDSNYTVYQQPEWYDETEKRYMEHDESFQVGHIYTVQIWTEAKDGYEFDSDAAEYYVTAMVNGKEAKISKAFEYQRWAMAVVSYTFPEVKEHKEITRVDVSDIKSDSYYYKAVLWAVEQGITGGTSATIFSPEDSCTRGQVVTLLYRFLNGQ